MYATALTAVLSVCQMPSDVPPPETLQERAIQTVLQVTDTHFVATNTSFEPQVLLFGSAERERLTSVPLRPGQRVVFPFPDGASEGVWVDVVSPGRLPHRATGALRVDALRDAADGTTWIEAARGWAVGWQVRAGALEHARAGHEHLGPVLRALRATPRAVHAEPSPTHVPVVSPSDDQRPPRPPKIDERPLPPV